MSLPKYIVNLDELSLAFQNLHSSTLTSDLNLPNLVTSLFEQINSLIPHSLPHASMRSVGLHKHIPALPLDFDLSYSFDHDAFITGISFSQSAWKHSDHWSLFAGDFLLFDAIFTKEIGQHKHFDSFFFLPAGSALRFVYHNSSGNSKQIWFDLDFLHIPPAPPPLKLPAGRDWFISLSSSSRIDIDACWADAISHQILLDFNNDSVGSSPNALFRLSDDSSSSRFELWSLEGAFRQNIAWGISWFFLHGNPNSSISVTLFNKFGVPVDVINDISAASLPVYSSSGGQFLALYEFDLSIPDYDKQWKRVNYRFSC